MIPQPQDYYFHQHPSDLDLIWESYTNEEIQDIYDQFDIDFQGPSLPPLQGPEIPSIQGPYLSNRLFNLEDPF